VGKLFVQSLIPEGISEEPKAEHVCEKSARSGLSQIVSILGDLEHKDPVKYYACAVQIDCRNLHAWSKLASLLRVVDAQKFLSAYQWPKDELIEIKEWVCRKMIPDKTPGEILNTVIIDIPHILSLLRGYLQTQRLDLAVSLIESFPALGSPLMESIDLACILAIILLKCKRHGLFEMAHYMITHYPTRPESFFVVGVYYISISRFDIARKFFSRSSTMPGKLLVGWIGYGLSFAYSDESGHAINAYRTATRLFPKSPVPLIYMGMEYIRTNELKLAQSYLVSALNLTSGDEITTALYKKTILNEIGIICLKAQQYDIAIENLQICCDSVEGEGIHIFLSNLGYAQLRYRDFDGAIKSFELSLAAAGRSGQAIAGLAYCHHCKGDLPRAIDLYNESLSKIFNRKIENLLNNLLQLAINEYSFSVKLGHIGEDMVISVF
jgi:tetratricopeptide (TPR) repeat protein